MTPAITANLLVVVKKITDKTLMRTVFLIFFFLAFVFFSPLVFIAISAHLSAPTASTLKAQLAQKDVYSLAINQLHSHLDTEVPDASSDDPLALVAPFIKKEITAPYIQKKAETLIDDVQSWAQGTGAPPVLSFKDLKQKLVVQHKSLFSQIEHMMSEVEAEQKTMAEQSGEKTEQMPFSKKDFDAFLKNDFTIPVFEYISWIKVFIKVINISGMVLLGVYAFFILCMTLLAETMQSKLRWIGWTLLITALWNIPGILVSTGSAVMIAKSVTENLAGGAYIAPFVEVFLTSFLATYARVTSGGVAALGIFSLGILTVSSLAKSSTVTPSSPIISPKRKK